MKKSTSIILSVLILFVSVLIVFSSTGVFAVADETEAGGGEPAGIQPVVTDPPTTAHSTTHTTTSTTTTTRFGRDDVSEMFENLTGKFTKTTTPAPTTAASVTGGTENGTDADGSETSTTKKTDDKKTTTTTKKVTTTVVKMTVEVIPNTTLSGTTMDALAAYYSRLNELGESIPTDALTSLAETTTETEEEEKKAMNPAVMVIIAVAAMLVLTCGLTGIFSVRNKRLAENADDAEKEDEAQERISRDVPFSRRVEPSNPLTAENNKPAADDTSDITDELLGSEDKTPDVHGDDFDIDEAPAEPPTEFDDFYSGRDDL